MKAMMNDIQVLTESELLGRCRAIQGWTLGQLALALSIHIPEHSFQRKGLAGRMIELALGAESGSRAVPDFERLGIELKTLPIDKDYKPRESTFITTVPLLTLERQWELSSCYLKLQRILWVPIEGDPGIPFLARRIGPAFLWSPSKEQSLILESDFMELTSLIDSGMIEKLSAHYGQYLQLRPKAMHAKMSAETYDQEGARIRTLPRGFYLRRSFTAMIWQHHSLLTK